MFVSLAASLTLIALVPAAFWLADHSLLPWQEDLRWTRLRAQIHAPATAAGDRVVLSRTRCFGWFPIYSVTLFASGRVVFEGEAYGCAKGKHEAHVDMDLAPDLLADLDAAGSARWLPGYVGYQPYCTLSDGSRRPLHERVRVPLFATILPE